MYTLMIVDDEKAIRDSLPLALDFEKYGFKVNATAKNGADALEKAELYHPDVILLDVCMPVLDGIGFLKKIHESQDAYHPCVVMLSGFSDFEYARAAMRYGVKAYLTKPLEEEELARELEELKKELDSRFRRQDDEKLRLLTSALLRMYNDGDGSREAYRGYMLMHFVMLRAEKTQEAYSAARQQIEERIPGGGAAFLRSRGSVMTYLVSSEILASYQYSLMLAGRHILHWLKQNGVEGAILFDETIFECAEGTFRNDYDTHLYRMLTEIFWGEERIIQNREADLLSGPEHRLEQEDAHLSRLKKALKEQEASLWQEAFDRLAAEVVRGRLNITFIQEIGYRIFYMLTDLIQQEGDESGLPIRPQDWRDSLCFTRYPEWQSELRAQVEAVYAYLNEIRNQKRSGIGSSVLDYLKEHFREPLLLKDAAERFYVTPAWLGRCVLKETGMSFKQYLNELRIEEAKRLLGGTDKLIYEIAEEVGFSESKYFVSKFTAEVGKTPLEYRKMMQEHK